MRVPIAIGNDVCCSDEEKLVNTGVKSADKEICSMREIIAP